MKVKSLNERTNTGVKLIRVIDDKQILSIEYYKRIFPTLYIELEAQKDNVEHPGFYNLSVKAQEELAMHLGRL